MYGLPIFNNRKKMKYQVIKPDENLEVTQDFVSQNWDSFTPELRQEKHTINASECKIYMKGQVWIVQHDGVVLYSETHMEDYPFFEMALHYMNPGAVRKWKTAGELITFRHAIREATVQGTCYVETILEEPLSERTYRKFMRFARAHDLVHHGEHTF